MGEGLKRAFAAAEATQVYTRRCYKCGEAFETNKARARVCPTHRVPSFAEMKGKTSEERSEAAAAEEARRKLPNMTIDDLTKALSEGRQWFTNGGTRWRYVDGYDGLWVRYYTKNHTTLELTSRFLKWAKAAHKEKGGSEVHDGE